MPGSYTGNPAALQPPSAAPGPGVAPTISDPADGEALTAASVMQMVKTPADHITYIQRAARLGNPRIPNGGPFTAVAASALGGTITPSGTPLALYDKWMIQIQTGGVVGTATFKTSIDGGNTYGALQTTAASMTDATTGITLAFAGTFLAAGTGSFYNAILPQAMWLDGSSNVRHVIDHNGYPMGRRSEFREEWLFSYNSPANNLSPSAIWQFVTNTANWNTGAGPVASYPASCLIGGVGTASGDQARMIGLLPILYASFTGISFVLEWEAAVQAPATTNNFIQMGLANTNGNQLAAGTHFAWFERTNGNWICKTYDGTNTNSVTTAVAPVANTMQRFRMEWHGSASPLGVTTVWFFINEQLVAAFSGATGIDAATNYDYGATLINSGVASAGNALFLGPIYATWSRYLSLPAL